MAGQHCSACLADEVGTHVPARSRIDLQHGAGLSPAHNARVEYVAHNGGIFHHSAYIGTIADGECPSV